MMTSPIQHRRGFTLVETLIALGLIAVLAAVVTSMLAAVLKSERRNRVIADVAFQGTALIQAIAQDIRNASAVTSPAAGVTSTSLTLAMASIAAQNPTVYSTTTAAILISRAGAAAIQLSSPTVTITSLTFQNVTAAKTDGAVQVRLVVSSLNPTHSADLNYTSTFITTATLR